MTGIGGPPAPRWPARGVAVLAVLGVLGGLLMALSHAGVRLPGLAALGPDGARVLPGVALGFAVGTVLFVALAVGAWRARPWAWAVGLTVNALAAAAAGVQWRGPTSAAALSVALVALALLLSPAGRAAFLGAPSRGEAAAESSPDGPGPSSPPAD